MKTACSHDIDDHNAVRGRQVPPSGAASSMPSPQSSKDYRKTGSVGRQQVVELKESSIPELTNSINLMDAAAPRQPPAEIWA